MLPFECEKCKKKSLKRSRVKTRSGAPKPSVPKVWFERRLRREAMRLAARKLETGAGRTAREKRAQHLRNQRWNPEESARMLELDVQDLGNWIRIWELRRIQRELNPRRRKKQPE